MSAFSRHGTPFESSGLPFGYRIEASTRGDLPAVNAVIERAVLQWPLPESLKRLVIPVLRYDDADSDHLQIFVCREAHQTVGVLALDYDDADAEDQRRDVSLHGLYVEPRVQRHGLGKALVAFAEFQSGMHSRDAITLRAERISCGFFERCGYVHRPPATDADYPYTYRKSGLIRRYGFQAHHETTAHNAVDSGFPERPLCFRERGR